ncbi:MAG: phosphatase PAP2 family protein [Xanthomonadales bacterium]|nr:phosphatase PAP2 family protein [Xanthomonadales bacterium]
MDGPRAPSRRVPLLRYLLFDVLGVTVLFAAAALSLRESSWDLRIEDFFYDPALHAFGLRHSPWLELLGHQLLLVVPIGIGLLAGVAAIASPRFEALRAWRPVFWALLASVCIGPLVIGILKQFTAAHCPWDIVRYGGYADYAQSWFASSRVEAGRCLPNSHAGAGFSLVALYFAGWASGRRGWRWWGLAIGLAAGLLFGFVRTAQGAHFASHSLWSAAIDWLIASLVFVPLICVSTRKQSPTAAVAGSS